METSVEVTELTSDNTGSDNLVPGASGSAPEWRSSDAGCTSVDMKMSENGEIVSRNNSGSIVADGSKGCSVSINSSASDSCENSAVKSVGDKLMTHCHGTDVYESHVTSEHVGSRNVSNDGGEIADSRSQTPLQDEHEPETDDVRHSEMAATSSTELDRSTMVNPVRASAIETSDIVEDPAYNSSAVQNAEENGEVSDDDDNDDDGDAAHDKGNVDICRQSTADAKMVEGEKRRKESEKVFCMLLVQL